MAGNAELKTDRRHRHARDQNQRGPHKEREEGRGTVLRERLAWCADRIPGSGPR
jgi:hypothetical protein